MLSLSLEIMPFTYYNSNGEIGNKGQCLILLGTLTNFVGECKGMNKFPFLCLLLILIATGLWGCSAAQDLPEMPVEAAAADISDAATSADTAPAPDEPTPTDETDLDNDLAVDAAEEQDYCIDCHTDQAMLTNTAAPEEEAEPENEGEG